MKHLEPLDQILEIKTKASHDEVRKVFEKLGLKVWDSKAKKVYSIELNPEAVKDMKESEKIEVEQLKFDEFKINKETNLNPRYTFEGASRSKGRYKCIDGGIHGACFRPRSRAERKRA